MPLDTALYAPDSSVLLLTCHRRLEILNVAFNVTVVEDVVDMELVLKMDEQQLADF